MEFFPLPGDCARQWQSSDTLLGYTVLCPMFGQSMMVVTCDPLNRSTFFRMSATSRTQRNTPHAS